MHDSRAIGNFILDYAASKKIDLTIMQLLKLTYISHGWSLAYWDKPLIKDDIEAWQYGPVIPNLYRSFSKKNVGRDPILTRAEDPQTGLDYVGKMSEKELSLIEAVVNSYGRLSAYNLSQKTHKAGTPWSEASRSGEDRPKISNELIHKHFKKLQNARQPNAA